jgi:hypothetical protein
MTKRFTRSHAKRYSKRVNNLDKNFPFFSLQPGKLHLPS